MRHGLLDIFVGLPTRFTLDEMFRMLAESISSGRYTTLAPRMSLTHQNPEAIFDLLLGFGFLGVRLQGATNFVFKYYGEQGNVFRSLGEVDEVAIHPAFSHALGLRDSAERFALKEATDEDIIEGSAAVGIRAVAASERAMELLTRLREIPTGMGGFRRYEELILEAVAFAFTSYLDNGRIQERNWAGTQVRDVVFDNSGETMFFKMIRDRHDSIMVPFECKNKQELEPGDFHQMEARLSNMSGQLGFICYRSPHTEPRRAEIEHLRDMFGRSHGKKVVLLLSDAKLAQVIQRRLKGKLDSFMRKWFTSYVSLYLAH